MSFRKIGEFVSPWFGKARNAFGCRLSVAKCPKIWILRYAQYDKSRGVGVLLTFGCSACLAFGFLALVSALLSWLFGLARLASLSAAQNLFLG